MSDPHDNSGQPGRQLLDAVDRASDQLGLLAEQVREQERVSIAMILAAAVAHEISNILTPVRGYAEAALECPDDRDLGTRALQYAAEGSERAMRAAEAVIESVGPRQRAGQRADTRQAALNAVRLLGEFADKVVIEGEPSVAAIGQVSLEQVLLNLLINARAAAKPGELHVIVRLHSTWNTVRIEVDDNGRGIPAARLAHLFSSGPQGRAGRGLGLLICRHLVEAAGGTINVRSQVGQGTCFTIDLANVAEQQSKAA
jgi:signal transduction histidine kinase